MKLSIITPSYNQGRFIEETIRSILNQTYCDYEYIIIDGGSTDNTLEIIKKYEGDKRLRWISEKDKGQTNAINKGINISKGEILAWLNSDDIYDNKYVFERIVSEFRSDANLDLVYGKCLYIDEKGNVTGEFRSKEFNLNRHLNYDPGIIPQASAFFSRRIYYKVGQLDESLNYSMDYDLWTKIAKAGKVKYVPIIFSRFRKHGKCKTVEFVNKSRLETLRIARKHGALYLSPMYLEMVLNRFIERFPRIKIIVKKLMGR